MSEKKTGKLMSDLDYALHQNGAETTEKEKTTAGEIVLRVVALLIVATYVVFLIFGNQIFGKENLFYLSLNVFSDIENPIKWVRALSFVILVLSLATLARFLISLIIKSKTLTKKTGVAIFEMISNLIYYAAIIALIFLVLGAFGVDTAAIVAGVGIVALIIGLGAQNIVQDLVAGFFIIVEKSYDVGDIVAVKGFRGVVKSIGLRATQIEDVGGNIMNVRNSGISDMINMTKLLSVANVEFAIKDPGKLDKCEELLKQEMPKFKERIPELVEGPFYLGVEKIDKSWGIYTLSFVATCEEGAKYRVERAIRRELVRILDTGEQVGR